MKPALWSFPTALVHVLFVELMPLWLANVGWYGFVGGFVSIIHKIEIGKIVPLTRCLDDFREGSLWSNAFLSYPWGTCSIVNSSFSLNSLDDEDQASIAHDLWQLRLWFAITPAFSAILAVCVVLSLFRTGCTNFARGDYLAWTYKLEKKRWYRSLVYLSAAGPFCLFVALFVGVTTHYYGPICQVIREACDRNTILACNIPSALLSAYAFAKLLQISAPVHHWDSTDFRHVLFDRSILSLVSECNDLFGMTVIDNLWRALNGDEQKLEQTLVSPSVHEFVTLASQLQESESEEEEFVTSARVCDLCGQLREREKNEGVALVSSEEHGSVE